MTQKYAKELVDKIVEKQTKETINGVEVVMKNLPDCDIKGAMDPRMYAATKNMALIMKFMPKSLMKMDTSPKSLKRLRKMFNNVDSTPMVQRNINVADESFLAEDGVSIPIKVYTSDTPLENSPILYYIHGGGFFAGSPDVVGEAMKLLVEKTNIIVFSVDYRLAPENSFPVGHEDTYSGLKWIYANASKFGGDNQNIFVSGDSAGGNLTLYCTNRDLEDGLKQVKGQIILYPTVNMGGVEDEYTKRKDGQFDVYSKQKSAINISINMLSSATDALSDFLGVKDTKNKYLTPYLDVSPNLPPTMFSVGEHDFLKIETLAYARKMIDLGLKPEVIIYKGLGHAYLDHVGNYPQSEDCVNEMGAFILKHSKG